MTLPKHETYSSVEQIQVSKKIESDKKFMERLEEEKRQFESSIKSISSREQN